MNIKSFNTLLMNQNKYLKIFIAGILLSSLTNTKPVVSQLQKAQTTNHKLRKKDRSFSYAKDITHEVIGSKIVARFAPTNELGQKLELDKLASDLGYDHFNWVNYVEQDPYGITDRVGRLLSIPYNDPPQGGYEYDFADRFPFYWDIVDCDRCKPHYHRQHSNNLKQDELTFQDSPADYRLQPGEAVEFVTSLVGVKQYDVANRTAAWEILYTFRWQLTNPYPSYGQTSLIEADITLDKLSPVLLNLMRRDGLASISDRYSDNQSIPHRSSSKYRQSHYHHDRQPKSPR